MALIGRFMLEVCSKNGLSLEFASEALRADKEVMPVNPTPTPALTINGNPCNAVTL